MAVNGPHKLDATPPPASPERQPLIDRQLDEEAQQESIDPATAENLRYRPRRALLGMGLLLLVLVVSGVIYGVWPQATNSSGLIIAEHGAVASELEECSDLGVDILKKGGNAMDAGIASALCIGTVNAFSSGIGGGGFLIYRPANTSIDPKVINFRETAPGLATQDMYNRSETTAQRGGLSVSVPGELRGYEVAHNMFGRLPWADLVMPSVQLARDGIQTPVEVATRLRTWQAELTRDTSWREVYAPGGDWLTTNQTLKRPRYADTLEKIARQGPGAFYEGEIAEAIVSHVRSHGGILTLDDMKNYQASVEEPLRSTFRGNYEILTCDAPSSGIVLIEALNILEHFNATEGFTPLGVHHLVESMKWLSAGRTYLGDPRFVDNLDQHAKLQSKAFADQAARHTSPNRTFNYTHYGPEYAFKPDHGTTSLTVIDSEGNTVTITTTINLIWGSGLMDPVTGVILNDEQDDFGIPGTTNAFGLEPSVYNFIRPGKRPLSSQTPTIVVQNGQTRMSLGGSGGSRIVTAILEAIIKRLDWKFDLETTVTSPRVHHQLLPDIVSIEDDLPTIIQDGLRNRGHVLEPYPAGTPRSEIQVVELLNGKLYAMSDPRKHGKAAGY